MRWLMSMIAATMVGALQLGRALGDNADGRAVLAQARKTLLQQYEAVKAEPASPQAAH